jgi:hypothetical protein
VSQINALFFWSLGNDLTFLDKEEKFSQKSCVLIHFFRVNHTTPPHKQNVENTPRIDTARQKENRFRVSTSEHVIHTFMLLKKKKLVKLDR